MTDVFNKQTKLQSKLGTLHPSSIFKANLVFFNFKLCFYISIIVNAGNRPS